MFVPVIILPEFEANKRRLIHSILLNLICFEMAFNSTDFFTFLASREYHPREKKAIVPKSATIVTTIINSTNVNAF